MKNAAPETPAPLPVHQRPPARIMQWRRWCTLVGGGWLAALACAASAQVPDAGRILRESAPPQPIRPAPPTAITVPQAPTAPVPPAEPNQPAFVLKSVKFNGNMVFSSDTLQALVADRLGQSVTLADLQLLAARVTAHYRNADYVLTQTVVPVQDVTGGEVEFSVLEGCLGRIKIERVNEVAVPDSMIEGVVSGLPRGRPLTQHELERAVLMLSDMPGMATQVSLEAGDESGTYDLIIEVKAVPRYSMTVDLDNQGSRATGEYRIGALGRINSPFGRGDNLDLRVLNSFGKGLTFGRAAYELPIGYSGLRASLAYARVQYELGKDFAALDAYGAADVVELAATYPLLRSRIRNLFGKVTLEHKQLNDHVGAAGLASKKRAQTLGVGFVYERRDNWLGGGYISAGLTGYAGKLDIRSQADLLADQDQFGRHTNGNFARASYQLSRLQALSATISAYLAIAGQWANKNLDSADKIAAGGPRTVRAFSGATGIGDEARILNAELRWSVTPDSSVSAFYDIGRVRTNHTAAAGEENHRTLSGYGLGLYWTLASGMAVRASLAWPYLNTGTSATGKDERSPRAYGQIVKMF